MRDRPDTYVLDGAGRPVPEPDPVRWVAWYDASERARCLAHDVLFGGDDPDMSVEVATVFLAVDRGGGAGTPVLWETMILGGPQGGRTWGYATREAALRGHAAACRAARRSLWPRR